MYAWSLCVWFNRQKQRWSLQDWFRPSTSTFPRAMRLVWRPTSHSAWAHLCISQHSMSRLEHNQERLQLIILHSAISCWKDTNVITSLITHKTVAIALLPSIASIKRPFSRWFTHTPCTHVMVHWPHKTACIEHNNIVESKTVEIKLT